LFIIYACWHEIQKNYFYSLFFLLSACIYAYVFYKTVPKDIFPEKLHFVCLKEKYGVGINEELSGQNDKYLFVKKWFSNLHYGYRCNGNALPSMYLDADNFALMIYTYSEGIFSIVLHYEDADGNYVKLCPLYEDADALLEALIKK